MPAADISSTCALTTPLGNSAKPETLLVGGWDMTSYAVYDSYRLNDPGFTSPATLQFTLEDPANGIVGKLARNQWVYWVDHKNSVYLFGGFVKKITAEVHASRAFYTVDCVDFSDMLDTSRPIVGIGHQRGTTDQDSILSALGNYLSGIPWMGCNGHVQNLATIPFVAPSHTTLRGGIEQYLAATGLATATYYVDSLGYLHTLSVGDATAPFDISDNPNYSTTVPAVVTIEDDATNQIDGLWVNGATLSVSGFQYATSAPGDPARYDFLDASAATTSSAAANAAALEFGHRNAVERVTLVVTGYDGWAKGQKVKLTNGPLGISAQTYLIQSVSMRNLSGAQTRQYTITAGSDLMLATQLMRAAALRKTGVHGQAIGGTLGVTGV